MGEGVASMLPFRKVRDCKSFYVWFSNVVNYHSFSQMLVSTKQEVLIEFTVIILIKK